MHARAQRQSATIDLYHRNCKFWYVPKWKKVALFDWRFVFHVWSFIAPGTFWGKTIALAVLFVRRSLWIAVCLRHIQLSFHWWRAMPQTLGFFFKDYWHFLTIIFISLNIIPSATQPQNYLVPAFAILPRSKLTSYNYGLCGTSD